MNRNLFSKEGRSMTVNVYDIEQQHDRDIELQYAESRVIGNGSFGVVSANVILPSNENVAIKKVLQDKRFKNRELQIMRNLRHQNVVLLKYFYYTSGEKKDELYLNLILEYVPETVYRVSRHFSKQRQHLPLVYVKTYMYQVFRALAYIHNAGICHRDVKPQNLLLNSKTSVVKLCDFGSAKVLAPGEPNVAYICSRYYRAPELVFGSTDYTTSIDVWSTGCVVAELLLGQPFFPGDSGVDQLVEIIKVLGTPTREEINAMNRNYTTFRFPLIRPHPWQRVFRPRTPSEATDLVSLILRYTPSARLTPMQAMAHEFFDELRDPECTLPSKTPLPPLFNFTEDELKNAGELRAKLQPRKSEEGASQTSTAAVKTEAEPSGSPAAVMDEAAASSGGTAEIKTEPKVELKSDTLDADATQ